MEGGFEDLPRTRVADRCSVSDISRLYENGVGGNEAIQNFHSLTRKSEARYAQPDKWTEIKLMRTSRRLSSPSILTTSITTLNEGQDVSDRGSRGSLGSIGSRGEPTECRDAEISERRTSEDASTRGMPKKEAPERVTLEKGGLEKTMSEKSVSERTPKADRRCAPDAPFESVLDSARRPQSDSSARRRRVIENSVSAPDSDSARRRERMKQSLTRLSESILSSKRAGKEVVGKPAACKMPTREDACVGTSFFTTTVIQRRNSTGSQSKGLENRSSSCLDSDDDESSSSSLSCSHQASVPPPNFAKTIRPPTKPSETSSVSSSRRRDSGVVNFDEDLIEDLLSPVSSIREESVNYAAGTLRIHPKQLPLSSASTQYASSRKVPQAPVSQTSSSINGGFVPSAIGQELMGVFSTSNDPGPDSQRRMWDCFLAKARLSSSHIEFADVNNRMPAVVFTLRGLLRFGDGDYGSLRTDCLPPFIQILTGRHAVCESPACVEAVESCCSLLAVLAIHPLSRRAGQTLKVRPSFEPVLLAQNCIVLQQLFGILAQQVQKWMQYEQARNLEIPLTNRAVAALLDIVFVHCEDHRLKQAWTASTLPHVRQSIPRLITMLADRLPLQIAKCVAILDLVLDSSVSSQDGGLQVSRQTAQSLHSAISKIRTSNPPIAGMALQTIQHWSNVPSSKKPSSTFSTLFGLGKSRKSAVSSLKSSIYDEYRTLL